MRLQSPVLAGCKQVVQPVAGHRSTHAELACRPLDDLRDAHVPGPASKEQWMLPHGIHLLGPSWLHAICPSGMLGTMMPK
jgi:hypothetical protein